MISSLVVRMLILCDGRLEYQSTNGLFFGILSTSGTRTLSSPSDGLRASQRVRSVTDLKPVCHSAMDQEVA